MQSKLWCVSEHQASLHLCGLYPVGFSDIQKGTSYSWKISHNLYIYMVQSSVNFLMFLWDLLFEWMLSHIQYICMVYPQYEISDKQLGVILVWIISHIHYMVRFLFCMNLLMNNKRWEIKGLFTSIAFIWLVTNMNSLIYSKSSNLFLKALPHFLHLHSFFHVWILWHSMKFTVWLNDWLYSFHS